MQVTLPKDDSEYSSIKMKHARDAEDPLDMAWHAPFAKKPAAPRATDPNKPKQEKHVGKGAAKRQQELDLSEQVLLKARQLCNLIQSPESTQSVTSQKVKATLTALQNRLRDNVMGHYTDDVCGDDVSAGASRTGAPALTSSPHTSSV